MPEACLGMWSCKETTPTAWEGVGHGWWPSPTPFTLGFSVWQECLPILQNYFWSFLNSVAFNIGTAWVFRWIQFNFDVFMPTWIRFAEKGRRYFYNCQGQNVLSMHSTSNIRLLVPSYKGSCACLGRKFNSRALASIFSFNPFEIREPPESGSIPSEWQYHNTTDSHGHLILQATVKCVLLLLIVYDELLTSYPEPIAYWGLYINVFVLMKSSQYL